MAGTTPDNEIPPIPVPPAPLQPVSPAPESSAPAAHPDPYAAPGQPAPYAAQGDQPQPYPSPSTPYAPVAAGPAQTLSIIAMIAGIVGVLGSFVGIGFLPAVAGVIMGHIAQKRQPWAKGFWVTALVTGYVGVAISVAIGLFALIIFLAAVSTSVS